MFSWTIANRASKARIVFRIVDHIREFLDERTEFMDSVCISRGIASDKTILLA